MNGNSSGPLKQSVQRTARVTYRRREKEEPVDWRANPEMNMENDGVR